MYLRKILWVLGGMILTVGLIFAVSTVAVLRNTVAEANEAREKAELVLAELRRASDKSSIPAQADPVDPPRESESIPPDKTETALPTAALGDAFIFRAYEGKIGIFTSEGYLIRTLDVDVRTLPATDRAALENDGIRVYSREETDALIEDFQQ